jgi:lipid A 3-O-deacylase
MGVDIDARIRMTSNPDAGQLRREHRRSPLAAIQRTALAVGLLLAAASGSAAADDVPREPDPARLVLTGGYGHKIAIYGLGALWSIPFAAEFLARHGLDARLGTDVSWWDGHDRGVPTRFLWDANITPYLRWRPDERPWGQAFAEIGVGFHLLSHTQINESRILSTAFQFGERFAVGFDFGKGNRYEVTGFVQHISNGRIKDPNGGLTYWGATIGIPFD